MSKGRVFAEERQIGSVGIDAVARTAGRFHEEAGVLHRTYEVCGDGICSLKDFLYLVDGNHGLSEQAVEHRQPAGLLPENGAVLLAHLLDFSSSVAGFGGDGADAFEKEAEPRFPRTCVADGLEAVVVFLAVSFEVVGQIEQGSLEDAFPAEPECNEPSRKG